MSNIQKIINELCKYDLTDIQNEFKVELERKIQRLQDVNLHELDVLRRWNFHWQNDNLSRYISKCSPAVRRRKISVDPNITEQMSQVKSDVTRNKYKLERSKSMEQKLNWSRKLTRSEDELNMLNDKKIFAAKVNEKEAMHELDIINSFEDICSIPRRDVLIAKCRKLGTFTTDVYSIRIQERAKRMIDEFTDEINSQDN